jgi:hypothetical protein
MRLAFAFTFLLCTSTSGTASANDDGNKPGLRGASFDEPKQSTGQANKSKDPNDPPFEGNRPDIPPPPSPNVSTYTAANWCKIILNPSHPSHLLFIYCQLSRMRSQRWNSPLERRVEITTGSCTATQPTALLIMFPTMSQRGGKEVTSLARPRVRYVSSIQSLHHILFTFLDTPSKLRPKRSFPTPLGKWQCQWECELSQL